MLLTGGKRRFENEVFLSLASNPGRTTMPSIGNTPQFRALLWTNIEKILDLLYNYVAQLSNLTKVLSKKKDPITHGSFIDELVKVSLSVDALLVRSLSTVSHCSMVIQGNWSASSGWAQWEPCESNWNHPWLVSSRRCIDQQEISSHLCVCVCRFVSPSTSPRRRISEVIEIAKRRDSSFEPTASRFQWTWHGFSRWGQYY